MESLPSKQSHSSTRLYLLSEQPTNASAFRWGKYRLSTDQIDAFRKHFEQYDDGSGPWSDEEVAEMSYDLLVFAVTVIQISNAQRQRKSKNA